jgi:hypothetical protein
VAHAPGVTAVPQDPVTVYSSTGQTITASGDSGPLNFQSITSGIASVFVVGATGTTPSMTCFIDVQDANTHWYQVAAIGVALTSGPNFTFGNFGPVAGAGYVLTGIGRLRWVVTGTTPSFTGVDFSVIGR